jgi:hypothetical protein
MGGSKDLLYKNSALQYGIRNQEPAGSVSGPMSRFHIGVGDEWHYNKEVFSGKKKLPFGSLRPFPAIFGGGELILRFYFTSGSPATSVGLLVGLGCL